MSKVVVVVLLAGAQCRERERERPDVRDSRSEDPRGKLSPDTLPVSLTRTFIHTIFIYNMSLSREVLWNVCENPRAKLIVLRERGKGTLNWKEIIIVNLCQTNL
jgi:hypothetical protein